MDALHFKISTSYPHVLASMNTHTKWSSFLPRAIGLAFVCIFLAGVFNLLHLKDTLVDFMASPETGSVQIGIGVNILLTLAGIGVFSALIFYAAHTGFMHLANGFRSGDEPHIKLLQDKMVEIRYQPIVSLKDGTLVGCEVLCRLVDGGRIIGPEDFISKIEGREAEWLLDSCVIEKALQDLSTTIPKNRKIKVAFNLFPSSVNAKKLHAHIASGLEMCGHEGMHIVLEVVEREYLDDLPIEAAKLKAVGYEISIDDFGTGFSNLGNILKLRPHTLKIDKSFVKHVGGESDETILVPTIVHLANTIGCEIIAEGIETEKQKRLLAEMGVHYGQGFLFSHPLPLTDFVALFNNGHAT